MLLRRRAFFPFPNGGNRRSSPDRCIDGGMQLAVKQGSKSAEM